MKNLSLFVALAAIAGCATSHAGEYVYFPSLASRVIAGDADAFRQVLHTAEKTLPGAQLEELAEISSKFVRINPEQFLRSQTHGQHCFGVGFMGPDFTDNESARVREKELRRRAIAAVSDQSLSSTKARCLAVLAGS